MPRNKPDPSEETNIGRRKTKVGLCHEARRQAATLGLDYKDISTALLTCELLAQGGFGRVYALSSSAQKKISEGTTTASHQRPLVLKVQSLMLDGCTDKGLMKRLIRACNREYKTGSRALKQQHPCLCGAVDAFVSSDPETDGPVFCTVMERVNGGSLGEATIEHASRANDTQPHHQLLADLAIQLVNAVHRLHTMGYVHRDIKNENVLVADGHVVLIDYGSARRIGVELRGDDLISGTPSFQPPEILATQGVDVAPQAAEDFWAVGAILHYLMTGYKWPFAPRVKSSYLSDGASLMRLGQRCGWRVRWPEPSGGGCQLPPGLVALVEGLLAAEPSQRWGLEALLTSQVFSEAALEALEARFGADSRLGQDMAELKAMRMALMKAAQNATAADAGVEATQQQELCEADLTPEAGPCLGGCGGDDVRAPAESMPDAMAAMAVSQGLASPHALLLPLDDPPAMCHAADVMPAHPTAADNQGCSQQMGGLCGQQQHCQCQGVSVLSGHALLSTPGSPALNSACMITEPESSRCSTSNTCSISNATTTSANSTNPPAPDAAYMCASGFLHPGTCHLRNDTLAAAAAELVGSLVQLGAVMTCALVRAGPHAVAAGVMGSAVWSR